jgi:protoheme IX farnesyltransferase
VSQSTTDALLPVAPAEEIVRPEIAPSLMSDLMVLTKARLSFLVLITTFVGFCMASSAGLQWGRLLNTLLGTTLAAAAAAVLNQVAESNVDRLMERTRRRPIPAGRISRRRGLLFGLALAAAGPLHLLLTVNAATAALAAATIAIYVLIYTPLKRRTAFCTLVGAVAGAIPPVIGWAALRPTFDAGAWVLFGVLFAWQMPHFLAIAWMYRDEYRQAGFVMLRRDDQSGCATAFDALICTLILFMVTVAPFTLGITGGVYLSGALTLDCAFLFLGVQFLLERDRSSARRLFFGSILYLPLVLALMVLTRV